MGFRAEYTVHGDKSGTEMATITRRASGRWQARVRRHGVAASETFSSRADAIAWARKTESEIERGLWRDTAAAERVTISDLIERYRADVLPRLRGRGYHAALDRLDEALGRIALARLSSADVARYRDARLRVVSQDTVRKELGLLNRIVDIAAMEWGYQIPSNPCRMVRKPSPGKARDRRLGDGEAQALWQSLGQCRNSYMLPLARLAVETAMRQGELLSLAWDRIDLKRRTAYLPQTKNGEARTVPLSSRAVEILRALPRSIDGRVFPLSATGVAQAWKRAVRRAELEDLRFHDLRHEAASRLFERGLDSMEVAAITGHKDLRMLKRYTHLRAQDLARKLG